MLALTRARNAGIRTPLAFRAAVERERTLRPLELVERIDSACAPTCVDLDACERRYLLVGGIDGSVRAYDTEAVVEGARARDDDCSRARSTPELVCVIEGGGAREANRAGASGTASGTASGAAATSEEIGHTYATSCVRWLPSDTGMFFSGSYDKTVKCWDANSLRSACDVELPTKCRTLALSDAATTHSLVAIGSDDNIVRLWDPASNAIAHTLSGHRGSVHAIEWLRSNEHALATGGAEGDVRLWDIRSAGAYMILDRHNTQPSARVDAIKDAMYAGASTSGTIEAGPKPASRKMADSVPDHLRADAARRCSSSSWGRSNDGGASSSSKRGRNGGWGGWGVGFRGNKSARGRDERDDASRSRLFPAGDGYSSIPAPAHDGQVSGLRITPCGMFIVSTGADGRIRRWDLSNGLNTYTPYDSAGAAPTASACQIAITADGERLYVPCTDTRVRVYRTHTGTLDAELKGHLDDVVACAYKDGGDAELFTCGKDANVLVWAPVSASASSKHSGDIDGDAWSDDDDADGAADAYGRPSAVADPNRSRSAPRGLGYRSIHTPRAR